MRHARVIGLVAAAITAAATAVAFAQATVTPVPDNAPVQTAPLVEKPATWGDVKAGATKAGTCAACHGLDGNPTDPQYPRLAGQSERYIAHQLLLFKTGQRTAGMAAVMMPFAPASPTTP
jgi:cytochrome c553